MMLRRRERHPEIMDRPDLDPALHRQALADLARINRLSRSAHILRSGLRHLESSLPGERVRVLDVATGSGDLPLRLWELAGGSSRFEWHACDISPTAIELARANAERAGAEIKHFRHDILSQPLPGRYHAVICSLFLHHLSEEEAVLVLQRMREAATHLVLVNDLRRSTAGYLLAWGGARVLSRSPVVHFDGPVSVRAAFTPSEAHALAERAGLKTVRVKRRWPCRFLLSGTP